jgi:hypothetical protein
MPHNKRSGNMPRAKRPAATQTPKRAKKVTSKSVGSRRRLADTASKARAQKRVAAAPPLKESAQQSNIEEDSPAAGSEPENIDDTDEYHEVREDDNEDGEDEGDVDELGSCEAPMPCREGGRVQTKQRAILPRGAGNNYDARGLLVICLRCAKELHRFPRLVCHFTDKDKNFCIDCKKKKKECLPVGLPISAGSSPLTLIGSCSSHSS